MYSFDERILTNELAKLSKWEQIGFALAVAARQLSNYEYYARKTCLDRVDRPRQIANQLMTSIQAGSVDHPTWTSILDDLMNLLPEESEFWVIWHALADDALSSLAYAVRCLLTTDPQEAAWTARRAYEAADQAAIRMLGIQPGLQDTEKEIKSHPSVQRELARQQRDVELLLAEPGSESISEVWKNALSETLLTDGEMVSLA